MHISITKRNSFAVAIMIAFIVISSAHGKDEQQFKNLKVLPKNISKDSLDAIMDKYKVALGVKCSFCHAKATDGSGHMDFASDDNKHKIIARKMMEMTADINGKYFNFSGEHANMEVVSCITCHHGKKEPSDDLDATAIPDTPKPDQPSNK